MLRQPMTLLLVLSIDRNIRHAFNSLQFHYSWSFASVEIDFHFIWFVLFIYPKWTINIGKTFFLRCFLLPWFRYTVRIVQNLQISIVRWNKSVPNTTYSVQLTKTRLSLIYHLTNISVHYSPMSMPLHSSFLLWHFSTSLSKDASFVTSFVLCVQRVGSLFS